MNAAHANHGCFGTQTAAVVAGGQPPSGTPALVEVWDGTSWTEVAELNTARIYGTGVAGISTDGILYGGDTPSATANTESWNGSTWTEINNLGTARGAGGGGGTSTAAIYSGGDVSPYQQTELWTTSVSNTTITVG